MNIKNVNEMINNCESGLLLKFQNEEKLFFEEDYKKLKEFIRDATNITYNLNEKINDYKIKKVYFSLPKYGQASLEII